MATPVARWRALRLLGRALSGDVQRATPEEWSATATLAIEHGLGGALAGALAGGDAPVPAATRSELEWVQKSTIARALRMRREAHAVVRTLNDAGVEPLLMKGALLLLAGALPLGGRLAADLDVVVLEPEWPVAVRALEGAGYEPAPGRPFLHPHELPFVHADRVAPVELHARLGGDAIDAVLPVATAWPRAAVVEADGLRYRALTPTDQIVHNVAHTQLQDLNHAVLGVPLRQLHTFVSLVDAYGSAIDWFVVERTFRRAHASGALDVQLALVRLLFDAAVPEPSRGAAARARLAVALAATGPVSDVVRNTRYALGAEYLDSLYHHDGRRAALAAARVRHLARTARSLGRRGVADAVTHPLR